ncbi:MAG: hypothetical protein K0S99_1605, partial [Thermomicrobiales bacterium]|nr:hypothetical protein [Thermomicrobiales bacterium]
MSGPRCDCWGGRAMSKGSEFRGLHEQEGAFI